VREVVVTDRRVVFTPSGKRGAFAEGTSLLDAARRLGVDLDTVCGGRGVCGRCQVDITEGAFAKHKLESRASHASPWGAVEQRFVDKRGAFPPGRRLGCQAKICGDLLVDVPPESQVHRQVVRKPAEERAIIVDPVVRLHTVAVHEPDMREPASDFRRLQEALAEQWGVACAAADLAVLKTLQAALRAGGWTVTVALRKEREIVAVSPGFAVNAYGVAIDVGSTTIAAYLCDLSNGSVLASVGAMNPQIRYGEDLMSRVSYAMMHPDGAAEMTRVVRETIDALIGQAASEAGISRDEIVEATLVGNPIMHHLALGLDPTEIGSAPFALAIDGATEVRARVLGLAIAPGAYIYALPCIAGHVGADTAGVVLAEAPQLGDELRLIVDVGTNAEIVFGDRERLLAASSPTGPAFEGAQISCGQRAAPGAIERVRIDRETLEPRFKVIGCDLWSDAPGFAEATAGLGVTGVCGSGIIEAIAELYLAGVVSSDGVIDGALAARTSRVELAGRAFAYVLSEGPPRLVIQQADVRAIQLAKAALYAGAKLLIGRRGAALERITLAGAFGAQIDPLYAMALGMIPDCALDRVASAGNAAGTGARIALLNRAARTQIEAVVRSIEKVETAIEPDFQSLFVAAMAFPHKTDAFPNLARRVALPAAKPVLNDRGRSRRRAAPSEPG
jgi:uncharacterized 2Fe-2S/4Fe-4S cluster protein (DUF4445 family)